MIFVQYGNADACEAKATAIAKATPANNVFMVLFPISRLVVVVVCLRRSPMLRKKELIIILAIVSVSMARLRLFARLRWLFARWTLFHGQSLLFVHYDARTA